jgi:hypothetical protein
LQTDVDIIRRPVVSAVCRGTEARVEFWDDADMGSQVRRLRKRVSSAVQHLLNFEIPRPERMTFFSICARKSESIPGR